MSEEATLLNPQRYVNVLPESLALSAPPRSLPAVSDPSPAIPLTSVRPHGAYQLGPAITAPLSSGAHRAVNTSKLPAWRRRGIPSLVGGIVLSLVSAAVIVYWFNQSSRPDAPAPRLPEPRREPPPVVSVSTPPVTPPIVVPPTIAPPPSLPPTTPPVALPSHPAAAPRPARPVAAHPVVRSTTPRATADAGPAAGAAASARPGYLTFIATPDAEVFEGNRALGRTPLTDRAIPSGHHTFRFVPGGDLASQTVQVDVQPGGSSVVEMRWDPANP